MLELKRPRPVFLIPVLVLAAFYGYRLLKSRPPYIVHSYQGESYDWRREYAVILPEEYDEGNERWPAILYLHGLGEVGEDLTYLLRRGLVKEINKGLEIPFIVIAPQAMWTNRYEDGWAKNEADVLKVLEDAQSRYRIDPDRLYLTGNSMGGVGSFYFASKYPERFAAVAPICGEGEPEWVESYGDLPFWVFHGEDDELIPVEGSIRMVEAMKEAGVDVKLTLYPGVNHNAWTPTYNNPEFYEWLLSHERNEEGTQASETVKESPASPPASGPPDLQPRASFGFAEIGASPTERK